jgi:hypothetical protein
MAVLVPAGFYSKQYAGMSRDWVNNSFGGVLYEIFWCLVVALLFPRVRPPALSAGVFASTSILEFLQLWHPQFLETIRSTFVGRTLIGTTFIWTDFIYYILGSVCGGLIVMLLRKDSDMNEGSN